MILLLGSSGYIGQAFQEALETRELKFAALSRKDMDYTNFHLLLTTLRVAKVTFVINAAGFTGKPNVDACETARADTLLGNTVFPVTVAQACTAAGIPWGHVSSGCIYAGAKIIEDGHVRVEKDLMRDELKTLPYKNPEAIRGFSEDDEPNFSFRQPPCSFYSGTKALAEEALGSIGGGYLWRLRIPFDENDNARNFLTKLQRYPKVYDNVNSLSHRGDFANACLDLWKRRAAFGIYNVTNPGFITSREVVKLIEKILKPNRPFQFWTSDEDFYKTAANTPRSNCVLDVAKLLATGVTLRPVREALENSLRNWKTSS
ncbi:MAG: sugar nucleotide-binding protein [Verrucomicrobiota bacterium]